MKHHSNDKLVHQTSRAATVVQEPGPLNTNPAEAAATQRATPADPQELAQASAGHAVPHGSRKRKQSVPSEGKPSSKKSKHKKAAAAGPAHQGAAP